jgi:hypothetical protein
MKLYASILSLLVALPTIASAAPMNSAAYFDELHQSLGNRSITDRVIDGTIYPQIDKSQPVEDDTWPTLNDLQKAARRLKVDYIRKANGVALQIFCRTATRGTAREFLCGKK